MFQISNKKIFKKFELRTSKKDGRIMGPHFQFCLWTTDKNLGSRGCLLFTGFTVIQNLIVLDKKVIEVNLKQFYSIFSVKINKMHLLKGDS